MSSIKLIASFSQEEREIKKFEKIASIDKKAAQQQERWLCGFAALYKLAIYGFYTFSFWLATTFIEYQRINPNTGEPYNTGEVLSVLISMFTGIMMFFGISPNIECIIKAKVVGKEVFDVIDRLPLIRDQDTSIENFEF